MLQRIGRATVYLCAVAALAMDVPVSASAAPVASSAPLTSCRTNDQSPEIPADLHPVRVASVAGSVVNARALLNTHGGSARLTKVAGAPDPAVLLDYGQNVGGTAYFDVRAVTGRPTLHVSYSEARPFLTSTGDLQVLTGAFGEDPKRYDDYLVNNPGRITSARIQGAERFQELRLTEPGTLQISAVGIRFTSLREPYQGSFRSSSDLLNRVWHDSTYTVQLDSLPADSEPGVATPPVIVDGAKRDRKVWGGDLLTAAQNVYYSTGNTEYVTGSLALLAKLQSPDGQVSGQATQSDNDYWSEAYSMTWVSALAEYYLYTGDSAFVRSVWPTAVRELAWNASHVDARGLLITHGYTWHPVDGQQFDGAVTADNALYFHILRGAAELAEGMGDQQTARTYRGRAAALRQAVNRNLFDKQTGVYDIADTRRGPIAQDANALAVLYGLAPAARVTRILDVLRSRLWTSQGPLAFSSDSGLLGAYKYTGEPDAAISPFASSLELWARFATEDTAGGMTLIRTLWGSMADPRSPYYTGTTWEILNSLGQPGFGGVTSLSHAWGAGAAPALSAYVLGVRPSTAGYRTWTVAPQPGDLRWARGTVPTPRGPLTVEWSRHGNAFTMTVCAPPHTTGTVVIPRVSGHVTVNGRPVSSRRLILR